MCNTRCKFTQKPRVANCIRVRTCRCSAVRASVTRGWCVKLEVDSLSFEVWQEKTKMSRKRERSPELHWKPIMLITCWYMVGLPFTGSVVCHTLPLFGKSTLGIISFDFLYDSFTRALPLLSFPVLSAFTLIPSTISHLWNQPCHMRQCSWQCSDALLTLLASFIKPDGSAHIS